MEILVAIVPFAAVVAIAVGTAYHTYRLSHPRLGKFEALNRAESEPGSVPVEPGSANSSTNNTETGTQV